MEPSTNNNLPATADKKEVTSAQALRGLLNSPMVKSKFEEMLGKRAPSFLSSVITAVSSNKTLGDCVPNSVITAAAVAASLDLPINPSLGFAHIVPYKKKGDALPTAQFQMGWKGFIQLALRSGQYKTINVMPVREGQIKKKNSFTGEMEFGEEFTSPKVIGYLLYFKLLNGYEKYFYMTEGDCTAHGKKYSQSFKKGYGLWVDNFEAMALKTVVKLGLSKYGVLSVDMQKAIESDQATINEDGSFMFIDNDEPESDSEPTDVTPQKESLADKLKAQAAPTKAEQTPAAEVKKPASPEPEAVTTPVAPPPEPQVTEKTAMQRMAGTMVCDLFPNLKGLKISEVGEDELQELLAKLEKEDKLTDEQNMFYGNACIWLGRKRALKNG